MNYTSVYPFCTQVKVNLKYRNVSCFQPSRCFETNHTPSSSPVRLSGEPGDAIVASEPLRIKGGSTSKWIDLFRFDSFFRYCALLSCITAALAAFPGKGGLVKSFAQGANTAGEGLKASGSRAFTNRSSSGTEQ